MNTIKKIDYRELSRENIGNKEEKVEQIKAGQKRFSLRALKDFYSTADKKVKIELVVFIAIVLVTIGAFVVYFIQRSPKPPTDFNEYFNEDLNEDLNEADFSEGEF